MGNNNISWKTTDELPMVEEMYRKIVILVKGRFSKRFGGGELSDSLHVTIGYWHVFTLEREAVIAESCEWKHKVLDENEVRVHGRNHLYGALKTDSRITLRDVVAWMWADDLVQLYDNGTEERV